MYKIIIKGDANQEIYGEDFDFCDCANCTGHNEEISPFYFDGYSVDVNFADYIYDLELKEVIEEGFATFKFEDDILYIITEYISKKKLNKKQLENLKEYTQGQWSDGIGECFEQELHNGGYVSMWHKDQKVEIIQKKLSPIEIMEYKLK